MNKFFVCLALFLCCSICLGQSGLFIENKGQIVDQNGDQRNDIHYVLRSSEANLFITDYGFSIQSNQILDSATIQSDRVDYSFDNFKPSIFKSNNKNDYYETIVTDNDRFTVSGYSEILALDEESGMSIKFKLAANGFKYDIILSDSYQDEKVNVNIDGGKAKLANDIIVMSFGESTLSEEMPEVYALVDNKVLEKSAIYSLTENGYQIKFEEFKGKLVIDPYLVYGTYYGGTSTEYGYGVASDSNNNFYSFGTSSSVGNIATAGAYHQTFNIYGNMFLVKFNESGQRLWGTYINSSYPNPRKVEVDNSGNIYLAGITGSGDNLATPGAHQTIFGGDYNDAFLAKFSASGFPIWATLYGGEGNDILNGFAIDEDGLYLAGYTSSHTQIATPGAFQDATVVSGFNNDAYLAKFDTAGVLQVATYLGAGASDDFADVKFYDNGVYVVGGFDSNGMGTPGSYLPTKTSNSDMFVTKFDENLNQVWGSYFSGNNSEGYYKLAVNEDKVYVTGYAHAQAGNTSYSTPNTHKVIAEGGAEIFIEIFDTAGTQWLKGTYFGGSEGEYPGDIEITKNGNIAITGVTTSQSQIATSNVHKDYFTYAFGNSYLNNDIFISVFNDSLEQVWGSYYGGEGEDYAFDMTVNNKNQLLISGRTTSQNGIAYGTSHQLHNGGASPQTDAFIAIFDADRDSVFTDPLQSLASQVCPKEYVSIPFEVTGTYFSNNIFELWISDEFGDFTNASLVTSAIGQGSGTFSYQLPYLIDGGNYKFRVDATSPQVEGLSSGDFLILSTPSANFTYQIGVNEVYFTDISANASSWLWDFDNGNSSVDQDPIEVFNSPGMYNVSLISSNSECSDTAFHQVMIEEISGIKTNQEYLPVVYPNPTYDEIKIQANDFEGVLVIETLDGKIIMEKVVYTDSQLNLNLEQGVYLISFMNRENQLIEVKKVIKL